MKNASPNIKEKMKNRSRSSKWHNNVCCHFGLDRMHLILTHFQIPFIYVCCFVFHYFLFVPLFAPISPFIHRQWKQNRNGNKIDIENIKHRMKIIHCVMKILAVKILIFLPSSWLVPLLSTPWLTRCYTAIAAIPVTVIAIQRNFLFHLKLNEVI